jgi:hypothetical protein
MRELTIPASKVSDFGTTEERLLSGGWEMALIGGVHRDCDALDRSNARVLQRLLAEVDPDQTGWDIMHCSHWAVGWYDHLIVDPRHAGVMKVLTDAKEAMDIYPALDEMDWSDLECEDHANNECGEGCPIGPHCEDCCAALHDEHATHCELHTPDADEGT